MSRKLKNCKVVALAGGVGGAKLVFGLDRVLEPGALSVVVNTGDDFDHFGLKICPDLDTVSYTLANIADKTHGWGMKDETYHILDYLKTLNAPIWFTLGDKDIAVHMERTRLLQSGLTLTEVTRHFCKQWGIQSALFPISDQPAPTLVQTMEFGVLSFQEYFVKYHFEPTVLGISYDHSADPKVSDEVLQAMKDADFIVVCPSNPLLSIGPILAFEPVREFLKKKPVLAVSPIVQGMALKGPAAKMFKELGYEVNAKTVLKSYETFINLFIYDELDAEEFYNWHSKDIITAKAQTVMKTEEDKVNLAKVVIELGQRIAGMD